MTRSRSRTSPRQSKLGPSTPRELTGAEEREREGGGERGRGREAEVDRGKKKKKKKEEEGVGGSGRLFQRRCGRTMREVRGGGKVSGAVEKTAIERRGYSLWVTRQKKREKGGN